MLEGLNTPSDEGSPADLPANADSFMQEAKPDSLVSVFLLCCVMLQRKAPEVQRLKGHE